MEVKIGQYGSINIGHKTKIGKMADVFEIGNAIRRSKGLEPKLLKGFLQQQSTWEYIAELSVILSNEQAVDNNGDSNCSVTLQLESFDFKDFINSRC